MMILVHRHKSQSVGAKSFISLNRIKRDGETLLLIKPIFATISIDNDGFYCKNDELGIMIFSSDIEECKKDFEDEVLFIWNEYGKEDEQKLTAGAKKLKNNILKYIAPRRQMANGVVGPRGKILAILEGKAKKEEL